MREAATTKGNVSNIQRQHADGDGHGRDTKNLLWQRCSTYRLIEQMERIFITGVPPNALGKVFSRGGGILELAAVQRILAVAVAVPCFRCWAWQC